MNLYRLLQQRAADGRPLRVLLIGAGKFGSMFLAQARRTPGLHIVAVADLFIQRARENLARVGWKMEQFGAKTLGQARRSGATFVTEDASPVIASDHVEIVVEATGNPASGIRHVLACCQHGKHIIMVNVEADALAGPVLARRASEAGIIYSLAYGDQPALICEMADWARAAGFEVIAAGKGTKYLPAYHDSTPDTVWSNYGFTSKQVAAGDFNAQMFNSFLDGTKSAIEMAAVANATGLTPAPQGLAFPPCSVDDLPRVLRPAAEGGQLHHRGQVEVVSSLERNGRPVARDLRWGVYVTFAADSDYARRCFAEYGLVTDDSGNYAAMYKPYHLIGLELGISVASVGARGEPTGTPDGFRGDAVAIAKRDLNPGELLDGEGGYTVWGRLMTAQDSLACAGLPIGLAHGIKVARAVRKGALVSWRDVVAPDSEAARVRLDMEARFAAELGVQSSTSQVQDSTT
ncbi:MAG: flagellar biosynthesis protein FlgA [Betaproteobacteria bacterium SG8_41]|nr:MAG: flagellar biosynthesis protein FlgA [Betaproteobacteria bacterium SG8_41]